MMSPSDDKAQKSAYGEPETEQALEWFIRMRAEADVGSHERRDFEAWLAHDEANRIAYANVNAMWNCPELTVATARLFPSEAAIGEATHRSTRTSRSWFAATAIAASLLLAFAFGPQISTFATQWTADYTTTVGETASVMLPDGSRVHLNSRTALALDFAEGRREVTLISGEAWFEVAHDSTRPFSVTAGFSTVHVTGTSFDVSRGDGEDIVHLVTGRVHLTSRDGSSQPLSLSPGQAARADTSSMRQISLNDTERSLAWREGWVLLEGTPLREALSELGRYTSARLMTLNAAILDTPVSGSFRIGEADDAIRTVVTAAGGTTSHLPGGFVIIR